MDKPMQFLMDAAKKEIVDMPSAKMPGYVLDLIEVRDRQWESELARLRAERDELRAALKNLVFTASKLWDDAKPIKDSAIIHATHPIIEQARAIISRTEGGEVE